MRVPEFSRQKRPGLGSRFIRSASGSPQRINLRVMTQRTIQTCADLSSGSHDGSIPDKNHQLIPHYRFGRSTPGPSRSSSGIGAFINSF